VTEKEEQFHACTEGSTISIVVYGDLLASALTLALGFSFLMTAACVWLLFYGSFEAVWLLEPKFPISGSGEQ